MGGVCGRSLTAGKIFFTGRQTCTIYLVLWLCDWWFILSIFKCKYKKNTRHIRTQKYAMTAPMTKQVIGPHQSQGHLPKAKGPSPKPGAPHQSQGRLPNPYLDDVGLVLQVNRRPHWFVANFWGAVGDVGCRVCFRFRHCKMFYLAFDDVLEVASFFLSSDSINIGRTFLWTGYSNESESVSWLLHHFCSFFFV